MENHTEVNRQNSIGKRVKEIRHAKGLSQELLAEISKTSLKTIQRLESGSNTPRSYTIASVAAALGTSVEALAPVPCEIENPGEEPRDFQFLLKVNFACLAGILIPFANILLPVYLLYKSKADQLTRDVAKRIVSFQLYITLGVIFIIFLRPIVSTLIFQDGTIGDFPTSVTILLSAVLLNIAVIFKTAQRLQKHDMGILTPIPAIF